MRYQVSKKRRFILFITGLLLAGLGVAMSTLPELGTSPITSWPYVMTFILPCSLGMTTIVLNVGFIFLQMAILRGRFRWKELGQLPTLFVFGFCIDFGMWLASFYIPENYCLRMAEVLLGCFFLAAGIALQLFANISLMPGDGFIRTVANEYKIPFSRVKICFDVTIVLLAILTSLIYFHNITGVREGTVVAAFLVGFLIRKLQRPLRPLKKWLYVPKTPSNQTQVALRHAHMTELTVALRLIDQAKALLKAQGIDQWQKGYPDEACIKSDILTNKGYFLVNRNTILGYLCIDFESEPAYDTLQGEWLSALPYVVIHRMVIDMVFQHQGFASRAFQLVEELAIQRSISSIRVDTDAGNKIMQHLLEKNGFQYCGVINFDNSEKIAFEKLI